MDQPIGAAIRVVKLGGATQIDLGSLTEVVIVCDSAGNRIGHFLPVGVPATVLEALRKCPISETELDRRREEVGGKPFGEVLRELGATA